MKKKIKSAIILGVGLLLMLFIVAKQSPDKKTNGITCVDGYAVQTKEELDMKSIERACVRFQAIYENYLSDKEVKVYYSIIPDKGYFAQSSAMDYEKLIAQMNVGMNFATYLDIIPLLTIEDYYRTDVHWRQERIVDIAAYLAEQMGAETEPAEMYSPMLATDAFYGSYATEEWRSMKADELYYLESETLKQCEVYDYETNKKISVYDQTLADSVRPYDLFLSGAKSLLTIENPNAESRHELILFRDSFGSSMAPLLVSGYAEITLVDIRFLSSASLDKFLDFDQQDVLFLYSTPVLNNSITFK